MAIDVTVGGAEANSWASVDEFKAYRAVRLPANATVTAASDALIEAALIAACRNVNQNFDWTGTTADPASDDENEHQALEWPRDGMLSRGGFAIPNTVIPKELKDAQCECAFQMIAGIDLAGDSEAAKQGLLGIKAGSVSVQFQQVQTATTEAYDLIVRRMTSEFNYISNAVPGEVRRILVPSWFEQPTMVRPIMFGAM